MITVNRRIFHRSLLLFATIGLFASMLLLQSSARAAEDYLAPDVAFKFSAKMADEKTVEITYRIADGYYMYRERFAFKADGAALGEPVIPPGKIKFDETFQKDVETYRKSITIKLPVEAAGSFTLTATSQGCADAGLCYSPMDSQATLSPKGGGLLAAITAARTEPAAMTTPAESSAAQSSTAGPPAASMQDSDMGRIEASLKSGKLLAIVPLFILLGLGLSFTPCVLPMVPILSFIIVGEGAQTNRSRSFTLSVVYALGMALVYTALGVAAGLIGEGLSASLQKPWVLALFAVLMVALSLSMFGVYQLQVPASIQTKLARFSERQSGGKLAGVFAMGAISAMIVGPCVAAPLAGALVYISQTRDVVVGGSALFAMAVGMSVPLLLVGLSAGALLPRAGAWMEGVKRFFGVLMLGLALWIASPLLSTAMQMFGWAALGIGYGAYLLFNRLGPWQTKAIGLIFAALGLLQLAGVATGGRDVLAPLAHLTKGHAAETEFVRVKSSDELDAVLAQSKGKTVMLDFYADWCVSCKEMEKFTFSDPRIQARFADMVLLQADVTANNADDKALLKRFKLFGPPGIIFFDKEGKEIQGGRVIGYQNADKFNQSLGLVTSF
ncbi:MAG TPA: protein-disulfide reductase DsbD [Noviherbaspirillum sp.]|jgi:thiol:disulfide interchange protein DsbD|nr:protein-disulfide reductase DsbD [Noviherbaspirillum sp.]HEV2609675.1 protein-disulfide reductase DsbD [Noviherbaspirillum sp.]